MQMQEQPYTAPRPVWIRGPQLRKRWGDMPNSTFYNRLQRGLIPQPEYPFAQGAAGVDPGNRSAPGADGIDVDDR